MKENFMKCLEMLLEHDSGFAVDTYDPNNKIDRHSN